MIDRTLPDGLPDQSAKGKNMEQITVNGKTYYSSPQSEEFSGEYKICILQRGWVMSVKTTMLPS